MRILRVLLGLLGLVLAYVGVRDLLDLGWARFEPVLVWLVVGNLLHDAVLAPVVVLLGVVFVRLAPEWVRMPVVTGFVVLGAATLLAVPVLGNYGNEVSNPSLMPRDYTAGWFVLAALVAVGVVAGCWWNRRHPPANPVHPVAVGEADGAGDEGHGEPGDQGEGDERRTVEGQRSTSEGAG